MIYYKTNIFKIYLLFFGLFWILSFLSYLIANKINIPAKQINFLIYILLFLINSIVLIVFLVKKKFKLYIPKKILIFTIIIVIVFLQFLSSLIQNNPIEWIPTLIRYLLYISTFIVFFYALKRKKISINNINIILYIISYILIVSGYYQLISGNVDFINGAYRVSGNFDTHHLGFALSLFVIIHYLYYMIILNIKTNKLIKLFSFITIFLLLYLFIASHSRLLLVILLLANALAFIFFTKGFGKKIFFTNIAFLVISVFVYIALYTDLFPRIKEMLIVDKIDPSTLYRIFIIQETLSNISDSELFIGIGLGGFNQFFFLATGENNVAAHNDYLLMLTEGGVFSLLLYLIYQFLVIKKILSFENSGIVKLSFVLFFGIEVLAFLENAHYFYQSELLIPIVLAILFTRQNNKGLK